MEKKKPHQAAMTCSSLGAKQLCHPASGDSVSQWPLRGSLFLRTWWFYSYLSLCPFLHLHYFVWSFIFEVQLGCHLLCKATQHSGEPATLSCSSV